ncbi:radical SAM/SPASM domain-containing protein [Anaeromyxobacter terrae]|uniref:radical SAM/SPASM domain-containing protein n=1 Tax=Anaeromyxobacter terrae TaxID=2925406 RepID=UPI001F56A752|nr:radical SAM protein [Anaeromyxobacter sp. SG22]
MSTHASPAPTAAPRGAPAGGPDGPWRITLVTNPDDCNLACAMCECGAARAPGRARDAPRRMDPGLARRVLEERRGSPLAEVIPSTMGEPLLWAGLDGLVDLCAADGLALNLTTNGSFPGRGAAAWAARLVPVASDVKLSWNGAVAATAEAVMGGLSFEAAMENVRALVAARDAHSRAGGRRCGVSFQVTAQEANVGELAGIVWLAASLGVDRVKLNHLQPRLPGLEAGSLRRSPAAIARWNAAVRAAREAAEAARLPSGARVILQNAVELAPDPDAPAPRGPCPFIGREAWIHPDGTFAPCPHPAAARGGLGALGSVAEAPLGAIWAGERFRALVDAYEDHPLCRACPLRRPGGA